MIPINEIVNTIKTIVSSSKIEQYYLGLSSDPKDVALKVRKIGFEHYVLIDFRLTGREAVERNKELFYECIDDKTSILYKKYHHDKRDKRFFPSLGGKKLNSTKEQYDIFLCWWNRK